MDKSGEFFHSVKDILVSIALCLVRLLWVEFLILAFLVALPFVFVGEIVLLFKEKKNSWRELMQWNL